MNLIKSYFIGKSNKKNYLGIEILRMILSFLIVIVHCSNFESLNITFLKFAWGNLKFYVPTFFINKIKQRFVRIFIFVFIFIILIITLFLNGKDSRLMPYTFWPIIFWIRYNIYNFLYGIKDKEILKNLYYQLLIGHGFYGVFWYLFNLILISVFFIIMIKTLKKNIIFIMIILYILIYIYNYLGYNEYIFSKFNHRVEHSIKSISSSLFYSISGFFLGSIKILNKFNKYKASYRIFIIILLSILIYIIENSSKINKYFHYIFMINIISIFLFVIFGIFPFDKIKINNTIICFINYITKYTGGIYYLHSEVRDLLVTYYNSFKFRNLKECLIIYLICYYICFLGSILFRKSIFKYIFF